MDRDSKLMISCTIGDRSAATAREFMFDLADRLATRVQHTTDGHGAYLKAVADAYSGDVDYAKLHGLPVITSPNGGALTSMTLIDLWLLSRMPRRTIGEAELTHAVADMTAALQASPAALAKVQAAVDAAVQDAVSRAMQACRAPLGASQRQ